MFPLIEVNATFVLMFVSIQQPCNQPPFRPKSKKWVTLNQKLLILPRFMTKRFLDFAPALGKTLPQQTLVPILGDFAFAVFSYTVIELFGNVFIAGIT